MRLLRAAADVFVVLMLLWLLVGSAITFGTLIMRLAAMLTPQ